MLKNKVDWPADRIYKSKTEWEPIAFFTDSLCNSKTFDLELGFFSSSAINVLSEGFALFIYNGGKMRMVINNILLEDDKQLVMESGNESSAEPFDLTNLKMLKETFSKRDKHFFDCLSYLISKDRLELKIIKPKGGLGIAHTKQGLFYDGENTVGFTGSCNFTGAALLTNIESFTVFCDWENGYERKRVNRIRKSFEKLFSEEDSNVEYLDASQVSSNIVDVFPTKQLKELLEEEERIYNSKKKKEKTRPKILEAIDRAKKEIDKKIKEEEMKKTKPRFPFEKPRDYQQLAFERWRDNGQKGLFAMATGTGKTITALNCLLEIYKRSRTYKAIILVPTITLVDQWEEECEKFNFNNVIKINSRSTNWRSRVAALELLERSKPNEVSYVIISTYASFARENVYNQLVLFPKRHVLFIADEAHNLGSPSLLKRLDEIPYLRRIGLSATPDRQYDDEGTQRIAEFFGAEKEYTFEYSMRQAIENGFLSRYYYYPHVVELTDKEMTEYIEITRSIIGVMNYKDQESQEILKRLLLKRKRIIHKAENKKNIFKSILESYFREKGSLKYTLVYVPEGSRVDDENADLYDTTDRVPDDAETQKLIADYTAIVRDIDNHVTVREFTAESKDKELMLEQFSEGTLDVLTSMKCLDEGVDIPRSELAIFCASTGNPRQFIQRRGRVLRTHKDKPHAVIHDLVVVPDKHLTGEHYNLEKNLVNNELKRVRNFALLSENLNDAHTELKDILNYYNISLFED